MTITPLLALVIVRPTRSTYEPVRVKPKFCVIVPPSSTAWLPQTWMRRDAVPDARRAKLPT